MRDVLDCGDQIRSEVQCLEIFLKKDIRDHVYTPPTKSHSHCIRDLLLFQPHYD